MPLTDAVADLRRAILKGADQHTLGSSLQKLNKAASRAEADEIESACEAMAEVAMKADLVPASAAVFACGILIESGADPAGAAKAMLVRGKQALSVSAKYMRALNAAWDKAERKAGRQLSEQKMAAISERVEEAMPAEAEVGNNFQSYAQALVTLLTRYKPARKAFRKDAAMVADASEFASWTDHPQGWLSKLGNVLDDEEIIVLHPQAKKGYRVRIAGITHNFQLHILLADELVGDPEEGWLPGRKPNPRVAAAMRDRDWDDDTPTAEAVFDLKAWTAVQPGGSVEAGPFAHVIWHEGTPADIPEFEGQRVIILSKPTIHRTWKAPRDFPDMVGELTPVARLTAEGVAKWLRKLAEAPRPEAEGDDEDDEILEVEPADDD